MQSLPGCNEVWRQRNATLPAAVMRRDFALAQALARLLKDDAQDSARRSARPNRKETIMNAKQLGIAVILADFAAFTAYAVYQYGYLEFYRMAMTNAITIQLSIDLVIALSLITMWMWRDARERGMSVAPYLVLTLTLGSIGPLFYLLRRLGSEATQTVQAPARLRHAS